jgi:hypothetical protein
MQSVTAMQRSTLAFTALTRNPPERKMHRSK